MNHAFATTTWYSIFICMALLALNACSDDESNTPIDNIATPATKVDFATCGDNNFCQFDAVRGFTTFEEYAQLKRDGEFGVTPFVFEYMLDTRDYWPLIEKVADCEALTQSTDQIDCALAKTHKNIPAADCLKLDETNAPKQSSCLAYKAWQKQNGAICDSAKSNNTDESRKNCYYRAALALGNAALCVNTADRRKTRCEFDASFSQAKDATICQDGEKSCFALVFARANLHNVPMSCDGITGSSIKGCKRFEENWAAFAQSVDFQTCQGASCGMAIEQALYRTPERLNTLANITQFCQHHNERFQTSCINNIFASLSRRHKTARWCRSVHCLQQLIVDNPVSTNFCDDAGTLEESRLIAAQRKQECLSVLTDKLSTEHLNFSYCSLNEDPRDCLLKLNLKLREDGHQELKTCESAKGQAREKCVQIVGRNFAVAAGRPEFCPNIYCLTQVNEKHDDYDCTNVKNPLFRKKCLTLLSNIGYIDHCTDDECVFEIATVKTDCNQVKGSLNKACIDKQFISNNLSSISIADCKSHPYHRCAKRVIAHHQTNKTLSTLDGKECDLLQSGRQSRRGRQSCWNTFYADNNDIAYLYGNSSSFYKIYIKRLSTKPVTTADCKGHPHCLSQLRHAEAEFKRDVRLCSDRSCVSNVTNSLSSLHKQFILQHLPVDVAKIYYLDKTWGYDSKYADDLDPQFVNQAAMYTMIKHHKHEAYTKKIEYLAKVLISDPKHCTDINQGTFFGRTVQQTCREEISTRHAYFYDDVQQCGTTECVNRFIHRAPVSPANCQALDPAFFDSFARDSLINYCLKKIGAEK